MSRFTFSLLLTTLAIAASMMIMCSTNIVTLVVHRTAFNTIDEDILETVLLLPLVTGFLILSRTSSGLERTSDEERIPKLMQLSQSGVGVFLKVIATLSLFSLVTPVLNIAVTAGCFHTKPIFSTILHLSLNVISCMFLVLQSIFCIKHYACKCTRRLTLFLLMTAVSANVCVCVRCMYNAVLRGFIMHDTSTTSICNNRKEIVDFIHRVFYSFNFIFSIYSILIFCNILSSGLQTRDTLEVETNQNPKQSLDESSGIMVNIDNTRMYGTTTVHARRSTCIKVKTVIITLCLFLGKNSFPLTSLLCLVMFITHLALDILMGDFMEIITEIKMSDSTTFDTVQMVYVYFISILAFFASVLVKDQSLKYTRIHFKHYLLIALAGVHLLMVSLETIDSIGNMSKAPPCTHVVLFLIKVFFRYMGVFFQPVFVLKSSSLDLTRFSKNKLVYIEGMLYFLALCNLERALVDVLLVPIQLKQAMQLPQGDYFGVFAWRIITRAMYPSLVFYRIHSSLMCFEGIQKMNTAR